MLGSSRRAVLFVLGLLLFGVSALEALLFPATYRASAFVAVVGPAPSPGSLEPVRLSRRLEEVTFDRGLFGELLREHGTEASDARAAWILRRAVNIASADGRTFEVSYTDSNRKRAQALCEHVARRVVSRASELARDGSAPGPVTATLLSATTTPSFPTSLQSLLLIFGAIAAAVAWSFGAASPRPLTATLGPEPAAEPEVAPGFQPPQVAPFVSPAQTLGFSPPVAPPVAAPAPGAGAPLRPEQAVAQAPSDPRVEVVAPPVRTDPMLPPPTPHAIAAAGTSPEAAALSPAPTGVQPGPMPLRRSTLILGSPIAPAMPTPLPAKPTPTSIFRPSPLPPAPGVVSPSSKPPPMSAARAPSAHSLDRAGARYSYVSTPVPAPLNPSVELRTVSMHPAPALDPEVHKPWRRQLFSLGVAQCFVTAVTSAGDARRDKARFAVELALCLAETGHARVLLVEADLAEPQVRGLLGVTLLDEENLSHQLAASAERPRPWAVLRCREKLHAFLQGSPARPELILGEQFRDCIIGLCSAYDFVVLNGPAAETGLAGRFTGWVDGAVIVAHDEASSGVQKAKTALGLKQFLKVYTPRAAVR